jgi:hypothetical protein
MVIRPHWEQRGPTRGGGGVRRRGEAAPTGGEPAPAAGLSPTCEQVLVIAEGVGLGDAPLALEGVRVQFEVPFVHPETGKEYQRMSPGTCITGAYDTSIRGEELCLVADLGRGAGAVRRLASASALVRELKGGKVVAIPDHSDPTPAA